MEAPANWEFSTGLPSHSIGGVPYGKLLRLGPAELSLLLRGHIDISHSMCSRVGRLVAHVEENSREVAAVHSTCKVIGGRARRS